MKNLKIIFALLFLAAFSFSCEMTSMDGEPISDFPDNPRPCRNCDVPDPVDPDPVDPPADTCDPAATPYQCGYILGYGDVNQEKAVAMENNPQWGTDYTIQHYLVDYTLPGAIGDPTSTAGPNTVTSIRPEFNEATFNISFYSSNDFQYKMQVLEDYRDTQFGGKSTVYWQGVIDGNLDGIWGF